MLPPDIDPQSRCRLPLVRREDLDAESQKVYDENADLKGGLIRGLKGPGGLFLHSPKFSQASRALGRYLRFDSGHSAHVREVAILVSARESNSQFEWAAHEPEALKQGVSRQTIDAIKCRKPLDGLGVVDAIIIQLGRETFGMRKLSCETYARALKQFGARGLIDLVALMGQYSATAALLTAFDMQLDEGETHILPVP